MGWFADHVLGGLVTSAVCGAAVWLSHRHLFRRIKKLTDRQTATLKNGSEGGGGGA